MLESFRSRLVISNLLITLVGLVVVAFVFTQVLANRSQSIRSRDLESESRLVARQIESVFQQHGKPGKPLQELVNADSRALRVEVWVVGPNGQQIAYSSGQTYFSTGSWKPLDPKALRDQQTASKRLRSSDIRSFQTPLVGTTLIPGTKRHRTIGAVILVANVSDVSPGLFELRDVFLILLGTALLAWLVIGLYFTFSISQPLVRVIAATRRMARGDYGARVPAEGQGEMARLAASFNHMAEQVEQSNQVLKDFVANVSHDLRTPLTMITGFSEALLDGTARDGEAEESAAIIHEEAIKMQHMVDDLLQLTRLESGLQTFRREPLAVRPFVQAMIERIQRTPGDAPPISIENLVPADTPPVSVDREHIERALRNLLNNALQYTPPGGTIRVGARAIGQGWVELSVADTGIGISQADLPRVFERFYRTDKSRERVRGHSGLGLAIVREIVEGHGGQITVESKPNRGTVFRFTLPQAGRPERKREPSAASDAAQQPATR
jgi:signal transduction histidine kinase